jgi:hypothetical protein
MNHQTVIGFYIDSHDGLSTSQIVDKIQNLSSYLISHHESRKWGIKDPEESWCEDTTALEEDNPWITDVNEFKSAFHRYIQYIKTNGIDDEDGCCFVKESSSRYEPYDVDIEEGDFEFEHSFEIDENRFCIYVNTESLFASEFEHLPSANLGISCDMNDIDYDYFEFRV